MTFEQILHKQPGPPFLDMPNEACNQGVALARSLTMSDVGGDSSEPAFLKKAAQRFV
ncbi:hypothetical protein E5288_WYG018728 [Bos mutus]|uniref:Uncharacterized protein n=1 Tax=Bos mutus TaxID=72004 RepID=A0A6B0QZA7_9CETA|nr:hypothetical protein [Bos mutus]